MQGKGAFRKHPLYRTTLWVALAISLALLWQLNDSILSNPAYIPVDDFSHYWAAGRLNTSGSNPYSPEEVQELRNEITGELTKYDTVPIMWTPPWSLVFVMPFGFFDYPLSRVLWLIAQITILLVSTIFLWKIYARGSKPPVMIWLIAFLFGPTISVLEKGQITPLVLFGIVGFIYFLEERRHLFTSGLFVLLVSLKPQLFYLFWPIFFLWLLQRKDWSSLIGTILAFSVGLAIPLLFNPSLIGSYIEAVTSNPPTDWATPTIGGYLRLAFGYEKFWLQFAPILLGLIGGLAYYLQNRLTWQWSKHVPVLLLISVLTAPYAWTYDQVILLPAILFAAAAILRLQDKRITLIFFGSYFGISLVDLILHRYLDEFWFGWLAPILILWYIVSMNTSRKKTSQPKPSFSP